LVYRGANGQTRDEMAALFGFEDPSVVDGLLAKLEAYSQRSIAQLANRLYVEKTVKLLETYVSSIGPENIVSVDFKHRLNEVTDEINKWVSGKTSGLIPHLIPDGLLNPSTIYIAVNAIYFKGDWRHQFPKEQTEDGIFHGSQGDETVPFMRLDDNRLRYKPVPELDGVLFSLPYVGDQFSMVIFLPDAHNGWEAAEQKLKQIYSMVSVFGMTKVVLKMPKWTMEATLNNLAGEHGILSRLGIPDAFSPTADFSNMTEDVSIVISNVVHKAKIIVDEEGTEAAAATAAVVVAESVVVEPPPIVITVDRPFVYFIIDVSDGTVLFQGTQTSIRE